MNNERPKSTKQAEYSHYNYSAYNRAVEQTLNQHQTLAATLRSENRIKQMHLVLLILAAICLVISAAVILYWFLFRPTYAELSVPVQQTQQQLQLLAEHNQTQDMRVTELFVQQISTVTAQGEIVTTEKEYQPTDLQTPSKQFCYLAADLTDLGAKDVVLAYTDADEVIIQTEDPYLLTDALPLCAFAKTE